MGTRRAQQMLFLGEGLANFTASMELEKAITRSGSVELNPASRDGCLLFERMAHEVAASDMDLAMKSRTLFPSLPVLSLRDRL